VHTIRLDIENTAPLDGTTPLDLSVTTSRTENGKSNDPAYFGEAETYVLVVTLPEAYLFGIFDPGETIGQRNKNTRLVSLTVMAETAMTFAKGDKVELVGPAGTRTEIVDLARNNGIYNNLDVVIPVDHKIAFNTQIGAEAGPYRIDMTFLDIEKPQQFFGREA
jgi:hypothetical protein